MKFKIKAERTIEVSMDWYLGKLEEALKEANDKWGDDATIALTPKLLELVADVGPGINSDPNVIADNFVVNGEFVEKEEFTKDGYYDGYYEQYNGDWQALCDDALIYDENYACMQF